MEMGGEPSTPLGSHSLVDHNKRKQAAFCQVTYEVVFCCKTDNTSPVICWPRVDCTTHEGMRIPI